MYKKHSNNCSSTCKQHSIRLSTELRELLINAANQNSRSLNKEIIARLEQSVAIDQHPELIQSLQLFMDNKRIFEEQYKMFEEINMDS
ncbi:Arc family DNA-binding protein [Acinetobacter baumannii]|uniref:Arc family DNA-binding protein n=1 Tax=Acinetobacter baumannii TaxID=470 RepID=UPI0010576FA5|nr:Arc family DNA-binding protein [Acinetobacter baumannii]MDC4500985.1 Arc family DNA-binding protein [Acinetobacter baumannii]MDC4727115.1 Arc family DNA-binding protein [Acinetobacter baumannii]MDC5008928.1 Arc family DNA-binding protein [Acinetobacter baumannii]MDC5458760.1 Arc family DNA-binding protein [Acinetobacter baumannii]MDC5481436.1 Arc family DNA-binding protein [Acinetobacter baumannii]